MAGCIDCQVCGGKEWKEARITQRFGVWNVRVVGLLIETGHKTGLAGGEDDSLSGEVWEGGGIAKMMVWQID